MRVLYIPDGLIVSNDHSIRMCKTLIELYCSAGSCVVKGNAEYIIYDEFTPEMFEIL